MKGLFSLLSHKTRPERIRAIHSCLTFCSFHGSCNHRHQLFTDLDVEVEAAYRNGVEVLEVRTASLGSASENEEFKIQKSKLPFRPEVPISCLLTNLSSLKLI